MELLEGIRGRHSIGKLGQDEPPRAEVETIIEAAVQAPNHHLTEPWRFFVLTAGARDALGELMASLLVKKKPDATPEERERERAKPLRAPVLIVVTCSTGAGPVESAENLSATAAAVENMLLAAEARGLAAQWRTGDVAYAPETKKWLGVPEDTSIVAIVYLGYAAMDPKPRHRSPGSQKTEWRTQ